MKINSVEYKNFRNLSDVTLIPDSGVNIIYGENAQGKTNMLEGIWLFSGLKSFRGAKDAEMCRFENDFARLKTEFETTQRKQRAEILIHGKRSATLNGVQLPSCAAMIGKFGAVVFSPSFLSIIKDGPAERRKFIDSAICQLKPSFTSVLSEYSRLIKQRNSLLCDVSFNSSLLDMLDVIDIKLSQSAMKISEERKKYLLLLRAEAEKIYSGISGGNEAISFVYKSREEASDKNDFSLKLRSFRKDDIINKCTSIGPHRDDIEIDINGIAARSFGSQGQQRSCAVAMKLAEAAVIKNVTGEQPVTLLDDCLSELDSLRQDYIINNIKGGQVFITCCEKSALKNVSGGKSFYVSDGKIIKES